MERSERIEMTHEKVQRPKSHVLQGLDWGKSFYYTHEADAFIDQLETERADLWRKNRELLGAHDVKAAALGDIQDELSASSALHASLVTKIKATRELIYKTQIAAEGGKSRSDCLAAVDGELAGIIENLEGR